MHAPSSGGAGRRTGQRFRAAAAGLLLLLALPGGALADAALIASTPTAEETLTTVPPVATLAFDHPLTGASSFVILDSAGVTMATGEPDTADPMVMRAPLPALAPGPYFVRWTAGSDDGHIVRGAFEFSVAAPTAPPPTPAPTDAPAATVAPTAVPVTAAPASATPAASASPGEGDGSGNAGTGGDVILPIIAVAVLIGGGLIVMLRRRGPA